jgi:hypothetical protein
MSMTNFVAPIVGPACLVNIFAIPDSPFIAGTA